MSILIIPDIHGRSFWKKAVDENMDKVDKIIFLGDYLDPYPWENITRKEAISNFDDIIKFKIDKRPWIPWLTTHWGTPKPFI